VHIGFEGQSLYPPTQNAFGRTRLDLEEVALGRRIAPNSTA
jgi:hypothetical protein